MIKPYYIVNITTNGAFFQIKMKPFIFISIENHGSCLLVFQDFSSSSKTLHLPRSKLINFMEKILTHLCYKLKSSKKNSSKKAPRPQNVRRVSGNHFDVQFELTIVYKENFHYKILLSGYWYCPETRQHTV